MNTVYRMTAVLTLAVTSAAAAQNGEIAPGDNLVVEGIPKIPASLADEVGRYTEFRTAILLDWHPARREILIATRFADVPQVHAVKFPGGDRRQLTFFPERILGASYYPRDGSYFVVSKDIGGNEFLQLFRFDLAAGDAALLTDGKSKNVHGVWSTAGDRMAYTSTRRNGTDTDIYVIDPSKPESDHLAFQVEGGGWQPLDWSPDDRRLLALEYISINESYLWVFDLVTKSRERITPKREGEPVAYGDARFSKDGKGVYTVSDEGSEFRRLAYVPLDTKRSAVLARNNWDVEELAL